MLFYGNLFKHYFRVHFLKMYVCYFESDLQDVYRTNIICNYCISTTNVVIIYANLS